MEANAGMVAGSYRRNELVRIRHDSDSGVCLLFFSFLGSPRVDGDEDEDDVDDLENEFNYPQGNGNAKHQWQGDDIELSSSSRHESQPIPLLTNGQPVSGEIPCATPDNQSVRTTSGPLGPAERNVHSSPYIDPRQPDTLKERETWKINLKGLDGIQGPVYVGTGCCFNRQALYGYDPVLTEEDLEPNIIVKSCCGSRKKGRGGHKKYIDKKRAMKRTESTIPIFNMEDIEEGVEGYDDERSLLMSQKSLEKRFGQSPVFIAATFQEQGGIPPSTNPATLLKEAIHVISCGYEDKTEWGKEIGWIYGSVTEDILTGFKMHARGWISIYCMPPRPAFKGSAPINLSDRLNQVLRWALGSIEILLSRHCPIWYGYSGRLKLLERLAYINTIVYPLTSLPLLAYCILPAICLVTGKFIIPEISNYAGMWFILLFISIFATGILELRWSGVGIEDWWRNEQFWVIGGTSAHLFAVFQGLLKVLAGIDTNFTVTSKASDEDGDFAELYVFKWTSLLIPPTTVILLNMMGIVAGVSFAINSGYQSWGPLFGKLFFAIWVIAHLYPFLKGLLGRQNRTPTIVIVWSILLASIFSLLWVRIDPFTSSTTQTTANGQCGINC
ncbi:hypothetical protein POTOM_055801 [Populus tomentosa]|uniref:Cellulose synthase n=1 Tax=Populus tomentosa TaxID=118781 RepID=A0A8X7XU75_POPTO|nr:hypothetical protein POTOM_055801 [Populus tomentosa]